MRNKDVPTTMATGMTYKSADFSKHSKNVPSSASINDNEDSLARVCVRKFVIMLNVYASGFAKTIYGVCFVLLHKLE